MSRSREAWCRKPVLPGIVHSFCRAFAEHLEEKTANGQSSDHPAELVLPTTSHTNLEQHRGWWLLVEHLAPMLCSQQELTSVSPALAKKENKMHVALPFHREPKLAQHSISRQNICYHQIYPSPLEGNLFFLPVLLMLVNGQQRVFYLKVRCLGDQKCTL